MRVTRSAGAIAVALTLAAGASPAAPQPPDADALDAEVQELAPGRGGGRMPFRQVVLELRDRETSPWILVVPSAPVEIYTADGDRRVRLTKVEWVVPNLDGGGPGEEYGDVWEIVPKEGAEGCDADLLAGGTIDGRGRKNSLRSVTPTRAGNWCYAVRVTYSDAGGARKTIELDPVVIIRNGP